MKVRFEEGLHFMLMRFHPNNQFHQFHDDVIPLFHQMKEELGGGSFLRDEEFDGESARILVLDSFHRSNSSRVYDYLTKKPARYRDYLNLDREVTTCFRDAILGSPSTTTWYQYGFGGEEQGPQSPIPDKSVNGLAVREVAEFLIQKMGLELGEDERYFKAHIDENVPAASDRLSSTPEIPVKGVDAAYVDFPQTDKIVILSRKGDRLISNEKDLARRLSEKFRMQTLIVSNEEYTFEKQVEILRSARM
jgi:protein O-mannose beta-1,4-N-acetylglucosaminyltransferase